MKATRTGKQIVLHFNVRGKEKMILGRNEGMLIVAAAERGADIEEIDITALPVGAEFVIIEGDKI